MPRLPAVDAVCLNHGGDLTVFLVGNPRSEKFAQFANFIRRQPGVKSVQAMQNPLRSLLYVEPTQPEQAVALLAALIKTLTPRRSVNVHVHFGNLAAPTAQTKNQTICAVEFVLPTAPEVVNRLCEQFMGLVGWHKGPATLIRCHEKFFVVKFETVRNGRPVKVILHNDLGLAVGPEFRLKTIKNGFTTEEAAVADLLDRLG